MPDRNETTLGWCPACGGAAVKEQRGDFAGLAKPLRCEDCNAHWSGVRGRDGLTDRLRGRTYWDVLGRV